MAYQMIQDLDVPYLDHGGVVALVGEYLAAGHVPGQGEEGRIVGHEAAGENQGGFLAVQGCQLRLELFMEYRVSRDVPVGIESLRSLRNVILLVLALHRRSAQARARSNLFQPNRKYQFTDYSPINYIH